MKRRNTKKIVDTPAVISSEIINKIKLLYSVFVVLAIVVIVVVVLVQIGTSGEELRERGERSSKGKERIEAQRGNILSDDGRILVTSVPMFDLRVDFAAPGLHDTIFNTYIKPLADSLSNYFGDKSSEQYVNDLTQGRNKKHRYFRLAPRRVDFIELQRIKEFPLINLGVAKSGFIADKIYNRIRPYGDVASRVLGYVNNDGAKLGIEGSYDDMLRGIEGLTIKQKISGDFWIPIESVLNVEPKDGTNIQSTINIELQDIAQTALRERIVEVEADWGTIIVMEVETGHVKALANVTRLKDGSLVEDYNYAVGTSMEPGSTFKLPVLLAFLDDAKVPINKVIDTESGKVQIGAASVVDAHRGGFGKLTLEGVFAHSSNIGMAKIINTAYKGKESQFLDRIYEMGIGDDLNLQIPGEPKPTIKDPRVKNSGWDGTTLTMMSYGYALQMTPLQTLTIYNGLANDGKVMRPLLVSALKEGDQVVREYKPEVVNEQLASPEAIKLAQKSMEAVVEYGTGMALKNSLYKVAVKTGTAQIAMGRRGYTAADGSRHYLGSVAGYFPADNPKYSIMIAFKTHYIPGSGKIYYGGSLASPLFKVVADNIYNSSYDLITPYSGGGDSEFRTSREVNLDSVEVDSLGVPVVEGMRLNAAVELLESRGYRVVSSGRGFVREQKMVEDGVVELVLEL